MTLQVAVVGGGIGGLTCAIALHRAGARVAVLERWPEITGRGTALGMWPEALRALDAVGLGDRVREIGVRQREMAFRTPDGRALARLDVGRLERRGGELPVLLSRAALIRVLREALPAHLIRTGTQVRAADLPALRAEHDVVVGADGIHSVVRSAGFGAGRLRYSGYTAWIGVVPGNGERGQEILGRGRKFGITPAENGMTNFYAPVWAPANYPVPGGALADLRARFGDWCEPVPSLLERAEGAEILRNAVHHLDPPLRDFVRGNLALLGDAAHAMTADLGQGACQALADGAALGRCLAEDGVAGLRRYDRERRRASQRVAAGAKWLGGLTMRPGLTAVRNGLFRTAGVITGHGSARMAVWEPST
ncbi:FAD-dependent monooxygenase [Amycolatopsis anabasis]|uniref:FAD-dependent monooxygenase n=1 Tax=Amycolatopsis anabasis TaxID=1840409 RepID=UPI00131B2B46|nr:FAD-dependent monooxygenase [Amycolatopsis anabasis]